MKSTRSRFPLKIASALLCLLVFASVGFAATKKPLNGPLGLAVDAKGNLYVANLSGNNILVYRQQRSSPENADAIVSG